MTTANLFRRGAILGPPFRHQGTGMSVAHHCNEQNLRFAALYFDDIVYLHHPELQFPVCGSHDFLQRENVLEDETYEYDNLFFNMVNGRTPLAYALINDALKGRNDGELFKWTAIYDGLQPNMFRGEINSIFLSFYSTFPVPSPLAATEDILHFRRKNLEKLKALRRALSRLAERLAVAQDKNDVYAIVQESVQSELDWISKILHESNYGSLASKVTIGIQSPGFVVENILKALCLPAPIATFLSNTVSLGFGTNPFNSPAQSPDWVYLFDAKSEGIVVGRNADGSIV